MRCLHLRSSHYDCSRRQDLEIVSLKFFPFSPQISYEESHDEEGVIGEPLLYQGQDFADSDDFLPQNGSSDTYDPHLDDSGGGDGGEMAFEDFDFPERITVKVEPGQEEAMANLQVWSQTQFFFLFPFRKTL